MRDVSTDYKLKSFRTKNVFEDTGWLLSEPSVDEPSLIRAIYANKQLNVKDDSYGLYKYSDWLPVRRFLEGSSAPVTFKSEGLANYLGLPNLYIVFSGWFPKIGAKMPTCSFKETEVYPVCSRIDDSVKDKIMVVASAGNTARSFAKVCSDNNIPLLLCMPYSRIEALWFDKPLNPCVKLICTPEGTDYYDAIFLSEEVCKNEMFYAEGGAKNVARRDGMATTMLSAVTHIGKIPDYYFQAIGSGTGAVAAWEANLRFIEDGRFGSNKTKLMLSQNIPFTPMYDAWKKRSRQIPEIIPEVARLQVSQIFSKVLSNRKPPYGVPGGLFDAMVDTSGEMFAVTNEQAIEASELYEKYEGIDIHPAAAVALASLIDAKNKNLIDTNKNILLNVTGGGEKLYFADHNNKLSYLKPRFVLNNPSEIDEVVNKLIYEFSML